MLQVHKLRLDYPLLKPAEDKHVHSGNMTLEQFWTGEAIPCHILQIRLNIALEQFWTGEAIPFHILQI